MSTRSAQQSVEPALEWTPATVTRDRFTSVADVVATVRRWGVIVFPGYVTASACERLDAELTRMVAVRRQLGCGLDEYENMINLRLERERIAEIFPATHAFFSQALMDEIAQAYFAPDSCRLNHQIFCTVLTETLGPQAAPPFALHFDKRQCLKFFVYLTDTDEGNGAMRARPGSIVANRVVRERASALHADLNEIANVRPEAESPTLPICGPAGTLFVFDTDMDHGAGTVRPGRARRTMRGHTQSHRMLSRMGMG
jgi:hypothetical protein